PNRCASYHFSRVHCASASSASEGESRICRKPSPPTRTGTLIAVNELSERGQPPPPIPPSVPLCDTSPGLSRNAPGLPGNIYFSRHSRFAGPAPDTTWLRRGGPSLPKPWPQVRHSNG